MKESCHFLLLLKESGDYSHLHLMIKGGTHLVMPISTPKTDAEKKLALSYFKEWMHKQVDLIAIKGE